MRKLYFILLLSFSLFSCMEDKGNYDYKTINEIQISGLEKFYNVQQTSIPGFSPTIKQSMKSDEKNLEFFWIASLTTPSGVRITDTLSMNRTLDVPINYATGVVDMRFIARNKESRVYGSFEFTMNVEGIYGEGLLVLSSDAQRASLTYLANNKTVAPIIDFISDIGTNPVRVNYHPKDALQDYVSIMCKDSRGGIVLDPSDFTKKFNYTNFFFVTPETIDPQAYCSSSSSSKGSMRDMGYYLTSIYTEHILNGGKIYERNRYAFGEGNDKKFTTPYLAPDLKGYEAAPFLMGGLGSCRVHFFDRKNKRFLLGSGENFTTLSLFTPKVTTPPFDPADMGPNMEALFGDYAAESGWYPICNWIFTNGVENYWISYQVNGKQFYARTKQVIPQSLMPVNDKTLFAVNSVMPIIYFTENENSVKMYNTTTNSVLPFFDGFQPDEKIVKILFEPYVVPNATGTRVFSHGRLYVAVEGNAVNGKTGSVYVIKVQENTNAELEIKYSNVAYKIVSMSLKR